MNRTLAALESEWAQIVKSPAGVAALARWRDREPALADITDLSAALDSRRTDSDTASALLAALGRLASEDLFAARALLQAVIPGLLQLAATSCADDPAAMDEFLSLAWERIRTYPPTREGSVAANILWDVRKRYHAHRVIQFPETAAAFEPPPAETAPSAEEVFLDRAAINDVVAAHRNGVIKDTALAIILRTRVDQVPLQRVAAEHQTTVRQVNCIRWRAERRLRDVLQMVS